MKTSKRISRYSSEISRRSFLGATAVGISALSASRVFGANERVNVGVIGFGLIGRIHANSFKEQSDVEIIGMAEAHQPRLEAGAALAGDRCSKYSDFRK